jgi:hypothetical protein
MWNWQRVLIQDGIFSENDPFLILFDESQKNLFGNKAHPNVYKTVFSKLCGFRCLENGRFIDSLTAATEMMIKIDL